MPKPSLNESASTSAIGKLTCCQMPGTSINRRSRIFALCFLANSKTVLGSIFLLRVGKWQSYRGTRDNNACAWKRQAPLVLVQSGQWIGLYEKSPANANYRRTVQSPHYFRC